MTVAHAAEQRELGIPAHWFKCVLRQIEHALLRRRRAFTSVDVEFCRTHMLPVAGPKAALSVGERQAKCFGKPHSRRCAAAISLYFTMSARHRGSEQSQGAGRRYGVSARLYGELDEDAFDVGLHCLGGNLQLLRDPFVGKSTAHRAQHAVFART